MNYDYNWENHFELSKDMFNYLEQNHPMGNDSKAAAISRSSIHLAYYACLNITKVNNKKFGEENQEVGYNSHDNNIRKISKYKITDSLDFCLKDLEADLLQLKTYRTQADYEGNTIVDYHIAKEVLKIANDVYVNLTKLKSFN